MSNSSSRLFMNFVRPTLCRIFTANPHLPARFAAAMIGATALAAGAAKGGDLGFTYNSPADVPVGAGNYTAAGTATLALNFAPAAGTNLTVVNNTGLDFIRGTFSNLAHGQEVVLSYGGVDYRFVANYYGGTGNDLVFQWANVRAMGWGVNGSGQLGNNSTTHNQVPVAVVRNGVLAGKTVIAVAAGGYHSLALCSDGTLAAWGSNTKGQLGNNSMTSSQVPVAVVRNGVLAGKTVIAVSAGDIHSLALCSDGTVAAWGWNNYGQLGNNTTTDSAVPVAVIPGGALAGKTVIGVSAGHGHTLAVCSDGTVASWGDNSWGQLGNNSKVNSLVPVAPYLGGALAGRTVIAVSAGFSQSAALCSDGTPVTWGDNFYGQLGNNSNVESSVPVAVARNGVLAGKTVTKVSMGAVITLALCSDGTVAAWGSNYSGGLGNNGTANSSVPVAVLGSGALAGRKAVAISAGAGGGMAICSDGTAVTWGNGNYGQLGDGNETGSLVPVTVNTSGLAIGDRFVSGESSSSQYHIMTLVASPPPPPSVTTHGAKNVSATGATLEGTVIANNISTAASFEYGTTTAYGTLVAASPSPVTGDSPTTVTTTLTDLAPGTTYHFRVNGMSANGRSDGADHAFISSGTVTFNKATDIPATSGAFFASGTVDFALNFLPTVGTNLTVVNNTGQDFINGTFYNLAQGQEVVLSYGGLPYRFWVNYFGGTGNDLVLQWAKVRPMSWGTNFNGQLGSPGALGSSRVPVAVSQNGVLANKIITAVASGYGHSVVLCSDGTLAAWGWNDYGQVGNGTGPSKFNPTPAAVRQSGVLAGKTVIAVSAGALHTVVLCSDGTLAAWGDNGYGQLGNNSNTDSNVPVAVLRSGTLAGKTFVAVAAGYHHNLALCSDGTLAAWGWNADGQLGINNKTNSTVPVPVYQNGTLAGRPVIAMSAGIGHSLVLCSDGTMAAWGDNSYGQLGNNDNSRTGKLIPAPVDRSGLLAGKTITAVTAGYSHCLAMCSDGTLATWGWNKDGQLGNNTTTNSSVPVAVSTSGVLAGKVATAISAGYGHNLALCSDGTLAAWGYNPAGQLGNNTSIGSTDPVAVTTSGLAAGERFFLARSGQSASSNLALVASPATKPASVTVSSGSDQLAEVNTPFGRPLEVLVRDSSLQPLSGVTVTFNKPGSGASGSFAGGVNTAVTNASGIAVSPVFSANTVAVGPYVVSASVPGGPSASFILTNVPAAASHFEISTPTVATAGASINITVTARDQFNNRATGFSRTVRFTSTDDGATLPADYTFMAAEAGFHRSTGGVKLIKAGQQSLTVTDTENPSVTGTGSINVSAGAPASMVATSGAPQTAKVNTAFALPLVAAVHDAFGNPVAGKSVTFTTPGSGPGATIGGNASITIITDTSGLAISGIVTANAAIGSYIVTATVPGVATPAGFSLGNGTQNPTATMPPTPAGGFQVSSQTGLFDITVPVQNTTPFPINGFRLHVNLSPYLAAYPSLRLYSASSPAGSPDVFVDYPYPVAVGGVVSMKLSFYTSTRTFPKPFAPGLSVETLKSSQVSDTNGSGVHPRLVRLKDDAVLLEFPSVAGHWYRVRYSENMIDWLDCPIALQAAGTRMQWIDRGPPFTIVPPSAAPSRFYLVNKIKTP